MAIITAGASAMVAILAYWLNHKGEKARLAHQAKLDWINAQLRELYGPLLVLSETNERTWREFRSKHLPPRAERIDPEMLSTEDAMRWQTWVIAVFFPAMQKMRDLLTDRGDLIVEEEMPEVILSFCAHVASYEGLIASWTPTQLAGKVLISHPGDDFAEYVRSSYRQLKREQYLLLRRR